MTDSTLERARELRSAITSLQTELEYVATMRIPYDRHPDLRADAEAYRSRCTQVLTAKLAAAEAEYAALDILLAVKA